MDSNQIIAKQKLGFSGFFLEALKILTLHPKFISFIIFISFPLFSSWLTHEILAQPTFIEILKILSHLNRYQDLKCEYDSQNDRTNCFIQSTPHVTMEKLKAVVSQRFLLSTLLSSAMVHILDLYITITIVYVSAIIYGGNRQLGVKEMLFEPLKKVGFKGPFITFLFGSLLSSLTLLGLITLSINTCLIVGSFMAIFIGFLFLVLLKKYIEWSVVWNMGIVISILDKNNYGYIAIGVSAFLSRSSRKIGFCLMLVFFVLRMFLLFSCLYVGWNKGGCGILGNVVYVCLNCVGNVVMWVVLTVYFYDCKKMFLEKKIDVEDGEVAAEAVQL